MNESAVAGTQAGFEDTIGRTFTRSRARIAAVVMAGVFAIGLLVGLAASSLVGSAGGFLKTGLYVDAGDVPNNVFTTNNKILNTIGAAVGCTTATGSPLDNFGDPALKKGMINAIIKNA